MRKIVIALAVLIALIVIVVIVAVSNVNAYLESNREMLSELASEAAGREVSYESARVAFSSGLAVRVSGLRVAEDERYGREDFLSLDQAFVGVRILPALQQRIEVSGIRFDAPTIRVIQTADGFNFSTLGASSEGDPAEAPDASMPSDEPVPDETEGSTDQEGAPLAVAIALLEIVDGTIFFEDRTSAEGLSLVIEDFETSGTDLALDGPVAIDFSARVRSARPGDPDLATELAGKIRLAGIEPPSGTVELTSPVVYPSIFGVRLEEGDVVERIDSLEVGATLTVDPAKSGYPVRVRSEEARLAGFDLDSIAIDLVYRDVPAGAEVKMEQVAIGLADGLVDLEGDVVLGEPGQSPFDLNLSIRDLDSGKLGEAVMGLPPGALSGKLGGDIALQGDSLEWESLKQSLAGTVELGIGEGALEQVNLLNSFVGGMVTDPGLGRLAADSIRDVAPEALEGDRTPFSGIDLLLEIADGAVQAKDLSMEADDFAVQAVGSVSLEGAISGDGRIEFSEDLSQKILAKADGFESILGDGKTVSIPLKLGGTTDSPSLIPDLSTMSKQATDQAKEELTNRAAKELNKFLYGKKKNDDSAGEDPGSTEGANEDQIKKSLDRIFGR